jgi:hypothetical protein
MLKLKANWTCSYCSKILKDPIELPCEDSICREHLAEGDVIDTNKIKCVECKQEFQAKDIHFKSCKAFKKLIESQSYLTEEEMSLKHELEGSIGKFFEFFGEFVQTRDNIDSYVFNHFEEMRFQIDEHREELKRKIDDIALEMIDKIKKNEEIYLKDLKEKFFKAVSFNDVNSLEYELNKIEETFRNPNLLIQTIEEMQKKQQESLNNLQLKLDEINQVKDNLKGTNEFKPNLSFLNQNETFLFGSIELNQYSYTNLFKSHILTGSKQCFDLINLCEFSRNDKWSLLYRGTRDGFGSTDFHSKCDGHPNTLIILKAKESSYIFGGFTTADWESPYPKAKYKSDPNAFLFSLTNKDNKPLKMKIDPNTPESAIYCNFSSGPSFGGGRDINVSDNANTTIKSNSGLGSSYKHPQYTFGTNGAKTFLAGSYNFQLVEIEVFKKNTS